MWLSFWVLVLSLIDLSFQLPLIGFLICAQHVSGCSKFHIKHPHRQPHSPANKYIISRFMSYNANAWRNPNSIWDRHFRPLSHPHHFGSTKLTARWAGNFWSELNPPWWNTSVTQAGTHKNCTFFFSSWFFIDILLLCFGNLFFERWCIDLPFTWHRSTNCTIL